MLPTTGHFKNFSCPFYDSCICERPYCHFKHSKRESLNDTNLISELVSKAVHKVLNSNINLQSNLDSKQKDTSTTAINKSVTYNPTPISELNKYKSNNAPKENNEKRNRHIPIQYTPEQPQSLRSLNVSYSHSAESKQNDVKNVLMEYKPVSSVQVQSLISYIPSSIKILSNCTADNVGNASQSSTELSNQPYVPSNPHSADVQCSAITAKYNPTKTLATDSKNVCDEYVPKYNDKFIDEFINDPNIYEPTEITSSTESINIKAASNPTKSRHHFEQCQSSTSKRSKKSNDKTSHSKYSHKSKHKKSEETANHNHDRKKQRSEDKCHKKHKTEDKHSKRGQKSKVKKYNAKPSKDHQIESIQVNDDYFAEISDGSDDSTIEQCKRIFEEYEPPVKKTQLENNVQSKQIENHCTVSTAKRRIAYDKTANIIRKKNIKPVQVKSAALVMVNRYKQVISNLRRNSCNNEPSECSSHNANKINSSIDDHMQDNIYFNSAKNKRIAHVPNVTSLLNAKKKVDEISKTKENNKTPIQTLSKGNKRIAHIPELSLTDMPSVFQSEKSKLPLNIRNRYLILMMKECVKLYISKKAAYDRALNEELNCYNKCSAINTYRNSIMLSINRLRKEAESGQSQHIRPSDHSNIFEFSGKKFYDNISKWILNEEELLENGYPRPGALKRGYALFKENKVTERIHENNQLCVRCKKLYVVDEHGYQLYPEDCVYHPGNRFVFRGETKYVCCKESSSASGCCICSTHVFEVKDPSTISGFVRTFIPENSDDPKSTAVYALDCEMVYTTRGLELARITVIDNNCDVVYESLVKPLGHILDCNTRFSGLTTEMLNNISTKITEVQATLLLMFNSKTILIGHSLESDLKALRLIHSSVIDTSILFPHKMGPPKKRALKGLASDYLKKIIQNDEAGHDSAEDAITCMELVIWKLKEELKLR